MERVWCYANDQLIPTNVASLVNYVGVLHLTSSKMSTVLIILAVVIKLTGR